VYQRTEFANDILALLDSPEAVEVDPDQLGEQVAKQFLLDYFGKLEYASVLKKNKIIDSNFCNYCNQISNRLQLISEKVLESNDYFIFSQYAFFIYFLHL